MDRRVEWFHGVHHRRDRGQCRAAGDQSANAVATRESGFDRSQFGCQRSGSGHAAGANIHNHGGRAQHVDVARHERSQLNHANDSAYPGRKRRPQEHNHSKQSGWDRHDGADGNDRRADIDNVRQPNLHCRAYHHGRADDNDDDSANDYYDGRKLSRVSSRPTTHHDEPRPARRIDSSTTGCGVDGRLAARELAEDRLVHCSCQWHCCVGVGKCVGDLGAHALQSRRETPASCVGARYPPLRCRARVFVHPGARGDACLR